MALSTVWLITTVLQLRRAHGKFARGRHHQENDGRLAGVVPSSMLDTRGADDGREPVSKRKYTKPT